MAPVAVASCVSQLLAPVAYTNSVCAEGLHFSAFHYYSSCGGVCSISLSVTKSARIGSRFSLEISARIIICAHA